MILEVFGRVLAPAFARNSMVLEVLEGLSTRLLLEIQCFCKVLGGWVEAVQAQAVEAAGSGVAVHRRLTTPARTGKK